MTDYKNGKIYKITDSNNEMIYIGSTVLPLVFRWRVHISTYLHRSKESNINRSNYTVYSIFDKYGIDKCSIQLIEEYPCSNKGELEKREGQIIRDMRKTIQSVVNKNIAGRTRQEWYIDNKDLKKKYYLDNKEKILKYSSNYYKTNKINKALLQQAYDESEKNIEVLLSIIDNTPDNVLEIVIN